jgi:NAD(P)-dependent dehydrogenase (short-subunit alcohol dehydrogenase family)
MTKALALEWARYGIRVNALAPGYFATELNDDFFEGEQGQALIKRLPLAPARTAQRARRAAAPADLPRRIVHDRERRPGRWRTPGFRVVTDGNTGMTMRFSKANGINIAYQVQGDGPPLVLIMATG